MTRPIVPNNPNLVRYRFDEARATGKVTRSELDAIVQQTRQDGFTPAEKQAVAVQWALLRDKTGASDATKAASARYRELAKKYDLPPIWLK